MSDYEEEPHFESEGDDGASMTYPVPASSIRKNGHLVIKGRPCKVVDIKTKTGKHGDKNHHFVGIDIFNLIKKLEDTVPSFDNVDVPRVNRNDYQLINIEDGFIDAFNEGKDLFVSVISAMGEEQIISVKDAPRGY
ncbi:hypothetical protein EJB05_04409 [Eragrostis curvula]|uniref:Eukaryotic translation initiation factor 5A n=1 Tax=Eragrostis curvula TaxID=38414 RepID=A0A5J9WAP4_9POAL|nr:hypothetical protein EJB05_04409 [Eragrostis curvula]